MRSITFTRVSCTGVPAKPDGMDYALRFGASGILETKDTFSRGNSHFTDLAQRPNPPIRISPGQFKELLGYVDEGIHYLKQGKYMQVRKHFANERMLNALGVEAHVFTERFRELPDPDELNEFLSKRISSVFHMIATFFQKKMLLYDAQFTNARDRDIQERINRILAYGCLEEWLHLVQFASGQYLSQRIRNLDPARLPKGIEAAELDIAAFYNEKDVPVPPGFLQIHRRSEVISEREISHWGSHALLPADSGETFDSKKQPSATRKLARLRPGQSVTIGRMEADVLIHTFPYGLKEMTDPLSLFTGGLPALVPPDVAILRIKRLDETNYEIDPLIRRHETAVERLKDIALVAPEKGTIHACNYWIAGPDKFEPFKAQSGQTLNINSLVSIELP